jgi:Bacterial TSP3 repeat
MQRLVLIAALSLSAVLVVVSHAVQAQGPVDYDDARGTDGSCTASGPADEHVVVCRDLRPGRGVALTDPGTEPAPGADDGSATPVPAPDAAATPETTDPVMASATDQDADTAPDELEPGLGLDPTDPDTDGDAVADGEEIDLYGTDPTVWDTDGDGLADGDELFVSGTDPLVWDTVSGDGSNASEERANDTNLVVEEGAAPEGSDVDSDSDRLADADEATFGTDPNTPDADGDGYYDGDEVNLGTDPLDPASVPTAESSPASA